VPTDKRSRQRAGREAKKAAEAKAKRRRDLVRNGIIVVVIAAVVVGSVVLITRHHNAKKTASSTTTTTKPSLTTTTAPSSSTTSAPSTTTTTAPATTTTTAASGSAPSQAQANTIAVAAGCPAKTSSPANNLTNHWSSAPPTTIDPSKTYTATVKTTAGTFVITLNAKQAPQTVNNFVFLANQGYYKCVIFHRVIPGFMDQSGDPTGTGTGGPGYTIPDENPPTASPQYPIGSVAMANTGQPHSGGSQFFIVTGPQGESLPNTYALFGTVTSGMNVVQAINAQGNSTDNGTPPNVTQRMLSVTISSS